MDVHRYLLFDSGCACCTKLAQDIERETGGWVRARSLRDAEMHVLLNCARPGWRGVSRAALAACTTFR